MRITHLQLPPVAHHSLLDVPPHCRDVLADPCGAHACSECLPTLPKPCSVHARRECLLPSLLNIKPRGFTHNRALWCACMQGVPAAHAAQGFTHNQVKPLCRSWSALCPSLITKGIALLHKGVHSNQASMQWEAC